LFKDFVLYMVLKTGNIIYYCFKNKVKKSNDPSKNKNIKRIKNIIILVFYYKKSIYNILFSLNFYKILINF